MQRQLICMFQDGFLKGWFICRLSWLSTMIHSNEKPSFVEYIRALGYWMLRSTQR